MLRISKRMFLASGFALGLVALAIVAAISLGGSLSFAGDPDDDNIYQSNVLVPTNCDASEWHWLINGLSDLGPSHIHVYFSDGSIVQVNAGAWTGNPGNGSGVTHYTLTTHLNDVLVAPGASAFYAGTYTRFNLSHGPCKLAPDITTTIHDIDHNAITSAFVDQQVHDSAAVSGSGPTPPTGSVTFTWWDNDSCTDDGTEIDAGTVNLDGSGIADPSDTETVTANGGSFRAHYNGDNNYLAADDDVCEQLASPTQATVDTTLHLEPDDTPVALGGNVPLGSTLHDHATVSDDVLTGDFTYTFYTGDCPGEDSISAGSGDMSDSEGPLGAGDYAFQAHFSGTGVYAGIEIDSDCEPFTVNKGRLSVNTVIHTDEPDEAAEGETPKFSLGPSLHDHADVKGLNDDFEPVGLAVNFSLTSNYDGEDCSDGASAGETSPEGDGFRSESSGALGAGSYAYNATLKLGDDPNYEIGNAKSPCEPFTVNKGSLSVNTVIHTDDPDEAAEGETPKFSLGPSLHDHAYVKGLNDDFEPVGLAVNFFLTSNYDGEDCSDGASAGETSPEGDGFRSESSGALGAGSYAYNATLKLGDDPNYEIRARKSDCEPFTVNKGRLSVNTVIHTDEPDEAAEGETPKFSLGPSLHDHADVKGLNDDFEAVGLAVNFFLTSNYDGEDCSDGASAGDTSAEGDGFRSESSGALGAGSYAYNATLKLGDDPNYEIGNAKSPCEPFTVNKGRLSVNTVIHTDDPDEAAEGETPKFSLGPSLHDHAYVKGLNDDFEPVGLAVNFFLTSNYDGEDCSDGASAGDTSAEGDGFRSESSGALGAGSYAYNATLKLGDDPNYEIGNAKSPCEPFTVNKGRLSVNTVIHTDDPDKAAEGETPKFSLGTSLHDHADVKGLNDDFEPVGLAVNFSLTSNYDGEDCSDGASAGDTSAEGDGFRSESSGALGAGSYAYNATLKLGDDPNYEIGNAKSPCEPFTVNKGTLRLATTIHDSSHSAVTTVGNGSTVHDTGTISGNAGLLALFPPDMSKVSFVFFRNNSCTRDGTQTSVSNAGTESALTAKSGNVGPLSAGLYSFLAAFKGDGNWNGPVFADACEPLTVRAVLGKTKGFWGNRNGQALIAAGFTYQLGKPNPLCHVDVTKANSTTVLPNANNGLSISTNCTALDAGLSTGAVNNLLGQVLALRLNQTYIAGYGANTIGGLACTGYVGGTGLAAGSTIQDVLNYANGVIGNLKSGGVVVTSAQVGDLNALLGDCLNREV